MKLLKFICVFFSLISYFSFTLTSSLAISIPEEQEVGKEFMEMVRKNQMLLNDPIASHMVTQVGKHLLSFLPPQPFGYSFYVVNEDVFNAFAAPGANIFAYRGLITSLDSIDELAGIIGHEIAHAVSRHVSESIDRSKYIGIGSLAGMLAGILIGSKSDGSAGATVVKGSLAVGQTAMLAFTRENETEADEKGIMFLKDSCFSPQGLLSGLMKIRASDFRGVEGIPDYVKTHPGTTSRIAHTETILSGYTPPENKTRCNEDFRFDMVKYRLIGLYSDIEPAFARLTNQLKDNPSSAAIHYGLGLLYERKFRKDEALSHLKKALAINVFDPMILLELGRIYQANGEPEKAINILKAVESEPVLGLMAKLYQANAYLDLQQYAAAETLYQLIIDKAPATYPDAYYNLANIKSVEKQTSLSHYYLGIFYSETGNGKNAILHLNRALENLGDAAKVQQAKELLEKLLEEAKEDLEKTRSRR